MGRGNANRKPVGLPTATAIVIGSMIGTGVFTSLGFQLVEIQSGFSLLLIWLLGGVFSLCGALCYAELAAAMPRSGGEYHLLSVCYHPCVGFLAGWISATVGFAAPVALAAMALGQYVGGAWPAVSATPVSVAVLLIVTVVHLCRPAVGGGFLNLFTTLKVLLIAAFALCAFALPEAQPVDFTPRVSDLGTIFTGPFAIALVFVMYAYSGWNATVYIVNEVERPQVTVPRSLLLGTTVVTLLYIGLNAGFLYSTPAEALTGEVEVGLVAGRAIFGHAGGNAVAALIALGLISMVSAMTWSGPRVTQMMGEDYPLLRVFARTTGAGIPYVAILLQTSVAMLLLVTATFESVLLFIEFLVTLSSAAAVFGVIYLRIKRPKLERPFRTPGYPVTPLCFLGISAFVMFHILTRRPVESLWGIGILLVGAALYASSSHPSGKTDDATR